MTSGLVRYLLRSWNALSAYSVHSKAPFFFISWKKGSARSPNLEMKCPSAVTHPVSFCISLRVFGGLMSSTALTFSGLASMPQWDTRKPKSLPEGTPNTHFYGLSRRSTALRLVKVSSKSCIKVLASRDFTIMSST